MYWWLLVVYLLPLVGGTIILARYTSAHMLTGFALVYTAPLALTLAFEGLSGDERSAALSFVWLVTLAWFQLRSETCL